MSSAKLDAHQPIWESSRRPLHPKCVWVESFGASGTLNGGHRHFIFDYNLTAPDRLRNETTSLTGSLHSPSSFDKIESFDALETKLMSLSIVGSSDKAQTDRVFNSLDDRSQMSDFSSEKEILTSFDSTDEEQLLESIELPKEMSSTPSIKHITNEIDSNKNLLAERVLQWLDLAGGRNHHISTKRSENIGKILHSSKRRSVTAKESRKISDLNDDGQQMGNKRREPIRQLSMTFNDEPIKESSDCINRNVVSLSFIDLFPTTYKCSRKFLSLRRPKMITDRLEPLDLQTTLPLKSTKKSAKHFSGRYKPKRLEYFDDQYSSIIQRQILETSCNTQAAKRQLIIFMPSLAKRCLVVNDAGDGDKMSTLVSPKSERDNESSYSYRLAST